MKIIKKEIVLSEYRNKENLITISTHWDNMEKSGVLSKEELDSARNLTQAIWRVKKRIGIDDNFVEMFRADNENNSVNLGSEMGADIGGIEDKGLKVIFINIEMGVNIFIRDPKPEDTEKYLKIFEMFNLGLENPKEYRSLLSYYSLDQNLEEKPKDKQVKI